MKKSDFQYDLPESLIAQFPPEKRGDSRLLELNGMNGEIHDRQFAELPNLLLPGDLLVFNNTKVMKARLFGVRDSGGKVEVLIERLLPSGHALANIRASNAPKIGTFIFIGKMKITMLCRRGALFELSIENGDFAQLMQQHGHMPLPPYITRSDNKDDMARYQTIYGTRYGAVAAPTAGLHFDQAMLEQLKEMGISSTNITLHVGAGTYQPVRADTLDEHIMHSEYLEVSESTRDLVLKTQQQGGRVIAVGTTSVRSLEAAAAGSGKLEIMYGDTELFIRPGYPFKVVDAMITNFHLSESTLLMLVAAFSGHSHIMAAYRHAIKQQYRFFSYGDAMFLTRKNLQCFYP